MSEKPKKCCPVCKCEDLEETYDERTKLKLYICNRCSLKFKREYAFKIKNDKN